MLCASATTGLCFVRITASMSERMYCVFRLVPNSNRQKSAAGYHRLELTFKPTRLKYFETLIIALTVPVTDKTRENVG